MPPSSNDLNTFFFSIYQYSRKPRVFILGKPSHPSLMFVSKAEFCLKEVSFRFSTLG
jgi:hypothetical protein